MLTPTEAQSYVSALRQRVDNELALLIDRSGPERLYDSCRYVLEGKGKRLRPILTLLSAQLYGYSLDLAMPVALSMEVFHAFTLVHDDIMDNSDLRRGRETVHVKWDEPTAILCGDFLHGLSVRLLSKNDHARIGEILALHFDTVRALCEGQIMDMQFEETEIVSVDEYLDMIDRKTAALLECCLQMGGLLGDASSTELQTLREIGMHTGRAFQIQDDLLDVTASDTQWGKAVGGDLTAGKKTYLLLKSLEESDGDDYEFFKAILKDRGIAPEKVPDAREKMRRLGVLEAAETTVIFHSETATHLVASLRAGKARDALIHLLKKLQHREH